MSGPAATVMSASVSGINRVTSAGQTPVCEPGPGVGVCGGVATTVLSDANGADPGGPRTVLSESESVSGGAGVGGSAGGGEETGRPQAVQRPSGASVAPPQ